MKAEVDDGSQTNDKTQIYITEETSGEISQRHSDVTMTDQIKVKIKNATGVTINNYSMLMTPQIVNKITSNSKDENTFGCVSKTISQSNPYYETQLKNVRPYNEDAIYWDKIPALKTIYSTRYAYMNSLLWDGKGYDFPLRSFFIDLEVDEDDLMGYHKLNQQIKLEEIFECDTYNNRILITGVPGSGKTTLTKKIAYDWASLKNPNYMSKFDLVLNISLRELGDCTVLHALVDTLFGKKSNIIASQQNMKLNFLFKVINKKEPKILVMLDGYDELLNTNSVLNFIRYDSLEICDNLTILITSRPYAIQMIGIEFHRRLSIIGFSEENQKRYIEQIFHDPLKQQELISYIKRNQFIATNTPLLLHMLCIIWKDSDHFSKSITDTATFYIEIFNLFMKRYKKKYPNSDFLEKGDLLLGEQFYIKLGKIAYTYLKDLWKSYENYVGITEEDVKKVFTDKEYNVIHGLDFIVTSTVTIKGKEIVMFNPVHLTFFEFLSALYLQNKPKTELKSRMSSCPEPSFMFNIRIFQHQLVNYKQPQLKSNIHCYRCTHRSN